MKVEDSKNSVEAHPWFEELATRFSQKQNMSPINTIKQHTEVNPCSIPRPTYKKSWSPYRGRCSKVRHILF